MSELNKIKFKLTVINTVVSFSVLLAIIVFIYISVGMTIVQNTDSELMSMAYQLKRYISVIPAPSSSEQGELVEDYEYFTERLDKSLLSFCVWGEDDEPLLMHKNFTYDDTVLSKCKDSLFTVDTLSVNEIAESDGNYYIHEYHYDETNIRICSTVLSNDMGDIRIIQLIGNMNEKNSFNDKLLRSLALSALFGVSVCFVCGYFIAGRAMVPIISSMDKQKEFVADASHELRTPITILRTNLDVVMSGPEESVATQMVWLENAYKETERMEKLITDLLFLARTDLKQTDLDMKKVDVNEVLEDIYFSVYPAAKEREIEMEFYYDETEPCIHADRDRIEQLILIVMDNAMQYTPKGGRVTVRTENTGSDVLIIISDTGIGISEEDIPKIFDRFYRADKARSRRQGGTGLGLSIAKWITDIHKGSITASSTLGEGTTIQINFPIYGQGE